MPFAPHDGAANLHAAHMPPVRPHREHRDLLWCARGPEVGTAEWLGCDIEGRGVHEDGSRSGDCLAVHVGDGGLQARVGRPSLDGAERDTQGESTGGVKRIHAARGGADLRSIRRAFPVLPPPAGLAEVIAVQSGDIETVGRSRSEVHRPVHCRPSHGRAKEVTRLDCTLQRIPGEAWHGVGCDRDEKLGWPILRDAVARARDVLPRPALHLE